MRSLVGQRLHFALAALLMPSLAMSCTANISEGTGSGGAGSPSGGGGNGSGTGGTTTASGGNTSIGAGGNATATGSGGASAGSTGGAPVVVGPGVTTIAESAGPLILRRLTHREFNNTVKDLIGDTTNPADSWSVNDGSTNSGFQAPNVLDRNTFGFLEPSVTTIVDAAMTANRIAIPCTNPAAGTAETTCATQFITTFGRRAYRRPVTDAERTDLLAVFTTAHTTPASFDFKTSIGYIVKAMLLSPNFLYHHWEIGGTKLTKVGTLVNLTPHQIASRLSYLLWESMPDAGLLDAADAGTLSTPDQIAAQAQRLLMDKTRSTNALYNFHQQWLKYDNLDELTKSTQTYPLFTDAFKAALPLEISAFVASVMLDGDGTLKTLLTAPYVYANAATAPAYGKTATGSAMQKITLDATQRAGILTQAAFLASQGQPGHPDPVHRGLYVYEQVLCGTIAAFNGVLPPVPATDGVTIVTNRQSYATHDSSPCASCHKSFDDIGYAFENYDSIGAYRTKDNGQNVDATGSLTTPIMKTPFSFTNAVELTNFLAGNDEVKSCVTRQWFRYLLGRHEVSADEGSIQAAAKQASANPGFSIPDLLTGMVRSMSFRMRQPAVGESI